MARKVVKQGLDEEALGKGFGAKSFGGLSDDGKGAPAG